jgi:hypothetical protein
MPYQISLNLSEILRTTLYLIEHTNYPGKASSTVNDLKECMMRAISEIDATQSASSPGAE